MGWKVNLALFHALLHFYSQASYIAHTTAGLSSESVVDHIISCLLHSGGLHKDYSTCFLLHYTALGAH